MIQRHAPLKPQGRTRLDKALQIARAETFRARHHAKPALLLPNCWDPMSARVFEDAGFDFLATTSGGVAWALAYPDGERVPWEEVLAATRRIVDAVQIPVSADIEAGYGATAQDVEARVSDIIAAGVAGINIEDGVGGGVRDLDDAKDRIRAARAAAASRGVPIVINARCDILHKQVGEESTRLAAVIERSNAFVEAGADCVYPFGLRDIEQMKTFAKEVQAPVNVTGRYGMPDKASLTDAGIARVSVASAPSLVAMSAIQSVASSLRESGGFESLDATIKHPGAQKLFARS